MAVALCKRYVCVVDFSISEVRRGDVHLNAFGCDINELCYQSKMLS
jgi:hypothetical protein